MVSSPEEERYRDGLIWTPKERKGGQGWGRAVFSLLLPLLLQPLVVEDQGDDKGTSLSCPHPGSRGPALGWVIRSPQTSMF